MRDCANVEARDQLPDLLHERLAAAERARVLAHVATCEDCAAELALLRATVAVASADVPVMDSALLAGRVAARLRTAPALPARRARWHAGTLRAAAAAVVMVGGTGVVLLARARGEHQAPAAALPALAADTATPAARARAAASAPAAPAAAPAATHAPASTTQAALGASFGDLTDEELAAVLDAVDAGDRGPSADPAPAPTIVTSGDVL